MLFFSQSGPEQHQVLSISDGHEATASAKNSKMYVYVVTFLLALSLTVKLMLLN